MDTIKIVDGQNKFVLLKDENGNMIGACMVTNSAVLRDENDNTVGMCDVVIKDGIKKFTNFRKSDGEPLVMEDGKTMVIQDSVTFS